jgi:hypothetical protein
MFGKIFKVATLGWMALRWYRSRNGASRVSKTMPPAGSPFRRR